MWFQIKLVSGGKLVGMVTPNGQFAWRLSDVGILLNKTNPYLWGKRYRHLTARDCLPERFHAWFSDMVLRTHVLSDREIQMILRKHRPELDHYLTWFFQEGRVMVEQRAYDNFNFHKCMCARQCPEGSLSMKEFMHHIQQKAVQFYKECDDEMKARATGHLDEVTMPAVDCPVKEEPLEVENLQVDPLEVETLQVDPLPVETLTVDEGPLHVDEGTPVEERTLPVEMGTSHVDSLPVQTFQVDVDTTQVYAGISNLLGKIKQESSTTRDGVEQILPDEVKLDIPSEEGMGTQQWIQTIYLPEERYKLDLYLRVERRNA